MLTVIGILAYVVKISMDYSKVKTKCESYEMKLTVLETICQKISQDMTTIQAEFKNNQKRDDEERAENNKKFEELYRSRNKTNDILVELSTTVKMLGSNIEQQFNSLEKKIDEYRSQIKGK